ncbi:hypothetical protein [Bosea lathyri]|uniref:Uncharacterized protein n=1 Tax=Bosea lathyri TaxID=1036778 RepID=A0A1H6CXN4_9HYPH|nr:hypothetical protein [Bosea lathyri]SEG77594.1 hypothetical protein SAMN04488115_11324 [Bosea lathyri]
MRAELLADRRFAAAGLCVLMTMLSYSPALAQSPAYRAGLRIANSRHYEKPDCYARVFAIHARRSNHPEKRSHWSAPAGGAFKGELWSQCGISR